MKENPFKVGDYIEATAYKSDGSFWFRTSKPQKVVEVKGNQLKMENGWCVHYGEDFITKAN